jgi:hypothetical protein
MQKKTTPRTEPLMPIVATHNELVAVGAAITTYATWLARSPESTYEHRDTLQLLDRFQRRLTQLPPSQEGGLYYATTK